MSKLCCWWTLINGKSLQSEPGISTESSVSYNSSGLPNKREGPEDSGFFVIILRFVIYWPTFA
ncbi:hypothetical protein IF2G_07762 [Cordyceps javanica]|nr:hypothetical protein IF2G_07762 [Cordyceps javanica]